MIKLAGLEAAAYHNEQAAPSLPPTDYYVAHLLLTPDDPGPDEVTPFYFVSVGLCETAPFLQLILDTLPSAHGYVRQFHKYNYSAALLHRFSYFLMTCYARNFDKSYAETLGAYLAKIVYVHPRVSPKLLELLTDSTPPPIVIAATSECAEHAKKLGFPCTRIEEETTAEWMNTQIGACFSTPAVPLSSEQKAQMRQGQFEKHISPNVFVATFPEQSLFGESNLHRYPPSGQRFVLPNEALNNQLRRRWMPRPPAKRPDSTKNLERALASTRMAFAQRLCDYLVSDPRFGLADADLAPGLRRHLEEYMRTNSADAFDSLVTEAAGHLRTYPGACDYILCCPAINRKSSERLFRQKVPDRILSLLYRAKAEDFLTYVRPEQFRSEREQQMLMGLMTYQAIENAYLSVVLALYATCYRQPVLRTPQLSNGLFGKLRSLRRTYAGQNWRAFNRDLEAFGRRLLSEFPPQVREFFTGPGRIVKVVSDLPLEWLPIDGVPLMFQHTVSRMPLTPGNAPYAHFNVCREDLHIGPAEAERILVCNCLPPEDNLYAYPELFVQSLKGARVQHTYVEPKSVKEYESALLAHKPYILVHWGHGSYDHGKDRGYLDIRDERTEIWNLRQCSVPPIVLLAACETAAIAETYNTPSNGWLALGARSVLASYFPVQADLTAILFGRIFSNLKEAVEGDQELETWASIVSKTLILNRYLDFFFGFVKWASTKRLPLPPKEVFLEYTYLWNQQHWSPVEGYRACPELLARAMDRFGDDLGKNFRKYLQTLTTVPHTMFFSHLGAPETIRIRKQRAPIDNEDSPVLAYWEMARRRDNGGRVA